MANDLSAVLNEFPTLGDLPEGKKFKYALEGSKMVFMKVQQPTGNKFDYSINDTDGRHYLFPASDGCWVVILESRNDCPTVAIGRILLLNRGVLVQELQ